MTTIILKGLPHENASSFFAVYVVVFMANGALNAWPAPACNNPIFAGERIFPTVLPCMPSPCLTGWPNKDPLVKSARGIWNQLFKKQSNIPEWAVCSLQRLCQHG